MNIKKVLTLTESKLYILLFLYIYQTTTIRGGLE